jgi:uncharacterized protein YndB with AHSA1/START domain
MDKVSVWIDASPETVWDLVTDVGRYGEWSPENRGGRWDGAPGLGATFTGSNRRGVMRWSTHCEVVEYDPPCRFAFEVAESKMRWGYRLEPEAGGTRVTEWRLHVAPLPLPFRVIGATGLLGRHREQLLVEGMRETLAKVKSTAERSRTHEAKGG